MTIAAVESVQKMYVSVQPATKPELDDQRFDQAMADFRARTDGACGVGKQESARSRSQPLQKSQKQDSPPQTDGETASYEVVPVESNESSVEYDTDLVADDEAVDAVDQIQQAEAGKVSDDQAPDERASVVEPQLVNEIEMVDTSSSDGQMAQADAVVQDEALQLDQTSGGGELPADPSEVRLPQFAVQVQSHGQQQQQQQQTQNRSGVANQQANAEAQQIPWVVPGTAQTGESTMGNGQQAATDSVTDGETSSLPQGSEVFAQTPASKSGANVAAEVTNSTSASATTPVHPAVSTPMVQAGGPQGQVGQALDVPLPNVDAPDDSINLARVARGLRSAVNQKGGMVTLRLSPPEMGFLRIRMQIQNGTVNATLQSENPQVRTLLSQSLGQLRSSLETQGLTVERLNVQTLSSTTDAPGADDQSNQFQHDPDGRSRGEYQWSQAQQSEEGSHEQRSFEEALLDEVA